MLHLRIFPVDTYGIAGKTGTLEPRCRNWPIIYIPCFGFSGMYQWALLTHLHSQRRQAQRPCIPKGLRWLEILCFWHVKCVAGECGPADTLQTGPSTGLSNSFKTALSALQVQFPSRNTFYLKGGRAQHGFGFQRGFCWCLLELLVIHQSRGCSRSQHDKTGFKAWCLSHWRAITVFLCVWPRNLARPACKGADTPAVCSSRSCRVLTPKTL